MGTGAYTGTMGHPSRNQVLLGWLSLDERFAAEQSLRQRQMQSQLFDSGQVMELTARWEHLCTLV